jgi:hypothetical protein
LSGPDFWNRKARADEKDYEDIRAENDEWRRWKAKGRIGPKPASPVLDRYPVLKRDEAVMDWALGTTPSARFRYLRKWAEDGKDYKSELRFFAAEIRSRRGVEDKWSSPMCWAGMAYDVMSDFGRSMMRPLLAWLFLIGVFTGSYLWSADISTDGHFDRQSRERFLIKEPDKQHALLYSSTPTGAALYLSLRKSFVFNVAGDENLDRSYACLFGVEDYKKQGLPTSYMVLNSLQALLSTILVFLFGLAVRNQFRIR